MVASPTYDDLRSLEIRFRWLPTIDPRHAGTLRFRPTARYLRPHDHSTHLDGLTDQLPDVDPDETKEWLEALDSVIAVDGRPRARYLMARLVERAGDSPRRRWRTCCTDVGGSANV